MEGDIFLQSNCKTTVKKISKQEVSWPSKVSMAYEG